MKKHGIEKRPLKCILLSYHGINNEVSEMFSHTQFDLNPTIVVRKYCVYAASA